MRICFISVGKFAHIGTYLEHFSDAGHDVHFVALSPGPPRSVPTYDVGLGTRYSPTSGKWKYPISMLRARRIVRDLRPDVVHTHFATSGGLAGLVCDVHPHVVTAHGSDLTGGSSSPVWRPLLKAVFDHADCVNTVSDGLRTLAVGLGVPASKIEVLSPGVDLRRFPPRAPRDLAPRLISIRRLDPECDPLTIVSALALLKRRGVPFSMTFAGDGRLRGEVEAAISRLGLAGTVNLRGAVAHDEVPALLGAHDIYLSASLRDGTSLSLLEAMASGLLPVVSKIPANAAWLEHGASGLLHAPGDPEDLANSIETALGSYGLARTAAAINRDRVERKGDRRENMARLEALYARLAPVRAPRSASIPRTGEPPFVSVVVPCRNEAPHIGRLLASALANSYPADRLEFLFVDGASTDGTREILAEAARADARIRVLHNPGLIAPAAMNLGIRASRGDVIVRMDAHSEYPPDFITRSVRLLRETGAGNAGGGVDLVPNGDGPFARAVAFVTKHPFGIGNSAWRLGRRRGFVDTVPGGAFPRAVFERVGLFDERLTRGQDHEFNARLRRHGYTIALDPGIRIRYWNQGTLAGLLRQAFFTGMWNVFNLTMHPYTWRWRRFVPGLFVAYLLALPDLPGVAALPLALYAALLALGARQGARASAGGWRTAATFAAYHATYGAGTLFGMANWLAGRRARYYGRVLKP